MTGLSLLSDAAIVAVCLVAAAGCFALNRRIRRLASSEQGIGKAVGEMSRSVAQFEALLAAAEDSTREASAILDDQLAQARKLVARLEAIAGAASSRTAPRQPEPARKAAVPGDPLSDVVPKGVSLAPAVGQRSDQREPGPYGTAQKRLAELALQRRLPGSDSASRPDRGARA